MSSARPETMLLVGRLCTLLGAARLRLSSEAATQQDIAGLLETAALCFEREARLSANDRVDFLVGGVALEVKTRGQRIAVFRQCRRYCAHGSVAALVLVTNLAMRLPSPLEGKPTAVVNLGKAWL